MNLSLASLVTIVYTIVSAAKSTAQSYPSNFDIPGPLATNILTEYVPTEAGVLKIHANQGTWNGARNVCLDEKAQLAVIDSAAKEAVILRHMKANKINAAWIGVHDLFGQRQWTTITGERLYTLSYVHWRIGEPSDSGAREHCVELHHAGMNDIGCETERSFISQLAVIDSAAKEAVILRHMKENKINAAWIGVHDLFGKKQWTTIKGERLYTLHYVHWRNGEPNSSGAGEHCVELLHHAGMNDIACETERSFICEKDDLL